MPRKNPKSDPVDAITSRVMELTEHIHTARREIEDLEVSLHGHEGPPREVIGVYSEIAEMTRNIETLERIAREAQAVVDHHHKTLNELIARKERLEAKNAELLAQIDRDQNALKSLVRDNLTPKAPGA
jgi:predicted RNase H-like nuclease (RuvC/YqgF family)